MSSETVLVYAVRSGFVMRDPVEGLWFNADGAIEYAAKSTLTPAEVAWCREQWPYGVLLRVVPVEMVG